MKQLINKVHITNFRDIGGYKSQDGRQVRYGCFYRSAPITFSSDSDRQEFKKLGIKNILDLRSDMEAQKCPDETIDGCHYIHCTAGKDRTGFAAYLILKTLGVPDDCILEDYMLSNVYRSEENQAFTRQIPNIPGLEELLCVKEEYLKTSIQVIEERYGDLSLFLLFEGQAHLVPDGSAVYRF